MTRHDPLSQLAEAFSDVLPTAIKLSGAVDAVANVHVNAKSGAVHGANQLQVGIRIIGDAPPHHFNSELGSLGFDFVDDAAAILDRRIQEFARQVFGVGAVPIFRIVRAGDVDAATGADGFGERHPLGHV